MTCTAMGTLTEGGQLLATVAAMGEVLCMWWCADGLSQNEGQQDGCDDKNLSRRRSGMEHCLGE